MPNHTETTIESELIYSGKIVELRKDTVELSDGTFSTRELVLHAPAVVVLPLLNENEVILVSQYRKPLEKTLLEIPAGLINPNEDPLNAAKRELREETGYTSLDWECLGEYYPTPGFCNEIYHVYLAKNLISGVQDLDEDERISVEVFSVDKLKRYIKNNWIKDAKTVLAFYLSLDKIK
ncbi:NUDIX hydrolase [bacterium]|jgi:ADP-ribose pyrophosphatase|nr:NUDIX hydrolase [bacterium]